MLSETPYVLSQRSTRKQELLSNLRYLHTYFLKVHSR